MVKRPGTPSPGTSGSSKRQKEKAEDPPPDRATDLPPLVPDNWLESVRKASSDPTWAVRKKRASDNIKSGDLGGMWEYSGDEKRRAWVSSRGHRNSIPLEEKTIKLNLEDSNDVFPAEEGDRQISLLYRELWRSGDTSTFLDTIQHFIIPPPIENNEAVNEIMPKRKVWRIFRCLVGELVPEAIAQKYSLPHHIRDTPDNVWEVGKCMFCIITGGHFWDYESNTIRLTDNGQRFGEFKVNFIQKHYSRRLIELVLLCLAYDPTKRPTRSQLLLHFRDVFTKLSAGVSEDSPPPPEAEDPLWQRPEGSPKSNVIPEGLTVSEHEIYENLINAVAEKYRAAGNNDQELPRIVAITDLAKDYDDLIAMMILSELRRLGCVDVVLFVANLHPADRRALFGRGAMNQLRLEDVKIARGTDGSPKKHAILDYEFANVKFFPENKAPPKEGEGERLLKQVFEEAVKKGYKITLLCISSLKDAAIFVEKDPELVKKGLGSVVFQGGYEFKDGVLIPDPLAANNDFDYESAEAFHKFCSDNNIPTQAYTKIAAFATKVDVKILDRLEATGSPVGSYLHGVQKAQDLAFYNRSCGPDPFRPFMVQEWYLKNKTTWYSVPHEPDEPLPIGDAVIPWLELLTCYDALAAIGTLPSDLLSKLNVLRPPVARTDMDHPLHKLIGIAAIPDRDAVEAIPASDGVEATPARDAVEGKPAEDCVHPTRMAAAVKAFMLGSLLATKQNLPPFNWREYHAGDKD